MPKILALSGAAILGLAVAVIPVMSASAHTPSYSLTCATAHVSLTNYDAPSTATIVVDGTTVQNGTFGGTLTLDIPLDATLASHTLNIDVDSTEGTNGTEYDVHDTLVKNDCIVATPADASAAAATTPASCTGAGGVTFSLSNADWENATDLTDGSRVANAQAGHTFPGGAAQLVVTYAIPAQLSGAACTTTVVTPPPPTPPTTTTTTPPTTPLGQLPTLAYTGSKDVVPLTGAALALFLIGGTGIWLGRRRTR